DRPRGPRPPQAPAGGHLGVRGRVQQDARADPPRPRPDLSLRQAPAPRRAGCCNVPRWTGWIVRLPQWKREDGPGPTGVRVSSRTSPRRLSSPATSSCEAVGDAPAVARAPSSLGEEAGGRLSSRTSAPGSLRPSPPFRVSRRRRRRRMVGMSRAAMMVLALAWAPVAGGQEPEGHRGTAEVRGDVLVDVGLAPYAALNGEGQGTAQLEVQDRVDSAAARGRDVARFRATVQLGERQLEIALNAPGRVADPQEPSGAEQEASREVAGGVALGGFW